jgi:MoaA/NifB/PqqE/SkfB family radical SAM enzyme
MDSFKNINSIDLYVNYACGLRCNHCFIGELLNSNVEMPINSAKSIVKKAKAEGVKSITLLGGEPTLYSHIIDLIKVAVDYQLEIRIVTNGQKSFQSVISKLPQRILSKLHVCFSIDGSSELIHDLIRGKRTFANLMSSIELVKLKKISFSGITSISKDNFDDTLSIIKICAQHKMKYLNIHYVTDRGFAKKNKVVNIEDWMNLCQEIESKNTNIPIRLEKTFISFDEDISCEVKKKKNIIIDPNGKIYGCTMFMNFENTESASWIDDNFHLNENPSNENCVCVQSNGGCPAMKLVNKELITDAKSKKLKIDCIFNKTSIN